MTSRIKRLQFAILYPFTRVTNTKSMTPNQLRHRASSFKGFRHIPLGPCSGFKAKFHDYLFFFFFFSFSFLFAFSFLFLFGRLHWSSNGGNTNLSWVANMPKAGFAKRKGGDTISHSIGIIWYVVCELAQRGNFQVEHAEPSTDQKLNQIWNCSSIKATCKVSIFRLKEIQLSN